MVKTKMNTNENYEVLFCFALAIDRFICSKFKTHLTEWKNVRSMVKFLRNRAHVLIHNNKSVSRKTQRIWPNRVELQFKIIYAFPSFNYGLYISLLKIDLILNYAAKFCLYLTKKVSSFHFSWFKVYVTKFNSQTQKQQQN